VVCGSGTLQEIIPNLDNLSDKIIRYLVSDADPVVQQSSPPGLGAAPSPAENLAELRARVELLERTVFEGATALRFSGISIADQHTIFGDKPAYEDVEKLAQKYMDQFVAGEIASVSVAYMRFITTSRQKAEILPLLPLKPPAAEGDLNAQAGESVQYEFTPSAEELLSEILPLTVKTTLLQCFNDAVVSEHVARMIAMKAATDNAGKMGKALSQKYNRARQSQITTELTEIISGAAALE